MLKNNIKRFLKEKVRPPLIPLLRAYIKYAPFDSLKQRFWMHIIRPYFEWTSYTFIAETFFGSKITGNTIDIIQRYIYYFGIWEPNLSRWMKGRLSIGDTFVDVGANIGYFSLYASKLVGDAGSVVAIEASPRIFKSLQKNIGLNLIKNIRAVNIAASDCRQMLKLYSGNKSNIGETTIFEAADFQLECETEAMPLSEILSREEINKTRLIKIDVEGAEWLVIKGLYPLLKSCRNDLEIIVEISPNRLAEQRKRPEDIVSAFENFGFHAYSLNNDYSPLSYLSSQSIKRPVRIKEPIQHQTDVVFSRQDSQFL